MDTCYQIEGDSSMGMVKNILEITVNVRGSYQHHP